MLRLLAPALISTVLLSGPGSAQEVPPKSEKPATPEIATCKTAALQALHAKEPEIKDIYIDEDAATVAVSEAKIENIPVTRIVMAEAYLRTDRSDKPRRFLCLLGEKNKVLLTFFTAR
ncbi:hypothetical protein ASE61_11310 [Bosea sp. Root670]|jgi:hypothetical protein|uniref:Uncharacterized protein n=1 Tax=Bosea robiniae TaxID=1036780 RepID=A0ABY0P759_9HYPH|nr:MULTISPECIES: hypothetical protein [Bosea]KRE03090.1 hypothetical protein ASE61_11310 [Bosea sp. Root670]TQI75717.1 hypothetical protein FHT98_3503 [Bosea sp. AK1]SDG70616.1 hypothetical protein SAMN05421844_10530 [Bosea robiniae]